MDSFGRFALNESADLAALVAACFAGEFQSLPWLVTADWLEENGADAVGKTVRWLVHAIDGEPRDEDARYQAVDDEVEAYNWLRQNGVQVAHAGGANQGVQRRPYERVVLTTGRKKTEYVLAGGQIHTHHVRSRVYAPVEARELPVAVLGGLMVAYLNHLLLQLKNGDTGAARAVMAAAERELLQAWSHRRDFSHQADCILVQREAAAMLNHVRRFQGLVRQLPRGEGARVSDQTHNAVSHFRHLGSIGFAAERCLDAETLQAIYDFQRDAIVFADSYRRRSG